MTEIYVDFGQTTWLTPLSSPLLVVPCLVALPSRARVVRQVIKEGLQVFDQHNPAAIEPTRAQLPRGDKPVEAAAAGPRQFQHITCAVCEGPMMRLNPAR